MPSLSPLSRSDMWRKIVGYPVQFFVSRIQLSNLAIVQLKQTWTNRKQNKPTNKTYGSLKERRKKEINRKLGHQGRYTPKGLPSPLRWSRSINTAQLQQLLS